MMNDLKNNGSGGGKIILKKIFKIIKKKIKINISFTKKVTFLFSNQYQTKV